MSKDMERLTEELEEYAIETNDFDVIAAESIAEGVLESTWLAEHDAALIEGLADEMQNKGIWAPDAGYMDSYEPSHVEWLREKARQRREEQNYG